MKHAQPETCAGLDHYSYQLIKQVTKGALSEIKIKNSIYLLCENVMKQATALAGMYNYVTNMIFSTAMEEGLIKFREHYHLMHKIMPWADQTAKTVISEVFTVFDFSQSLVGSIMAGLKDELEYMNHLKRLNDSAMIICKNLMQEAMLEYSRMPKFDMTVVDYDQPSQQAIEEWANLLTQEIMKYVSSSPGKSKHIKPTQKLNLPARNFADYNLSNNNNCDVEDVYDGDEFSQNHWSHGLYDTYAEEVMMDICALQNLKDSFVPNEAGIQPKPTRYDSCDAISIGSDLSSPKSSIDSRGLYHFADKLLYSLSILENRGNDFSCDIIENHSLQKDNRRSSAPALLTGPRRASLRTVFESDIYEDPAIDHTTTAKLGYPMPRLFQRRHHSIQESEGITLRDSQKFKEETYGDTMAKNIMCCAFKDLF